MFRTMIVDDEQTIRQGLKKIINWNALGFEVIEEAENGLVAFDKILKLNPDLILLDIKMPGYDGITLLQKIRAAGITSKVIYLTGFAEFEYAKKAIDLNVEAFLTKPFDEEELENVLILIAQKLKEENNIEQQLIMQKRLEEKQKFRRLLFGEKHTFDELDLGTDYTVVEVQSDAPNHIVNRFFDEFQILHPDLICMMITCNWVIIFRNMTKTRLKAVLYDLERSMKKSISYRYFISVGRRVQGQHELYKSFDDVKQLGQGWFFYEDLHIAYYDDHVRQDTFDFSMESDLLYSYVEVGNHDGIEQYFKTLEASLKSVSLSFVQTKGLCVSHYMIVMEKIKQHYPERSLHMDYSDLTKSLFKIKTLSALVEEMKAIINQIMKTIHTGSKDETLYKVLDYIDSHYDKTLTLERLGVIFGYNSSYLGTIFKQHTGMAFKHYLDAIRIEMAKKLLKDGKLKVYEVSEVVGYSNVDYFHSKFKKHERMSPKQFQKAFKEKG